MKVNIIGKGNGWQLAPMEEYSWGITQLCFRRPVHLIIDMNQYADGRWGDQGKRDLYEEKRISIMNGIEMITLDNYPLIQIMKKFDTDYFSNTVDYSIALALYRGYREIDLYGVNMAVGGEYAFEKPGVDFWCGVAKGLGCKVRVFGKHSTILRTRDGLLYGYDMIQAPNLEGDESP
jgi:hypothetical protein